MAFLCLETCASMHRRGFLYTDAYIHCGHPVFVKKNSLIENLTPISACFLCFLHTDKYFVIKHVSIRSNIIGCITKYGLLLPTKKILSLEKLAAACKCSVCSTKVRKCERMKKKNGKIKIIEILIIE